MAKDDAKLDDWAEKLLGEENPLESTETISESAPVTEGTGVPAFATPSASSENNSSSSITQDKQTSLDDWAASLLSKEELEAEESRSQVTQIHADHHSEESAEHSISSAPPMESLSPTSGAPLMAESFKPEVTHPNGPKLLIVCPFKFMDQKMINYICSLGYNVTHESETKVAVPTLMGSTAGLIIMNIPGSGSKEFKMLQLLRGKLKKKIGVVTASNDPILISACQELGVEFIANFPVSKNRISILLGKHLPIPKDDTEARLKAAAKKIRSKSQPKSDGSDAKLHDRENIFSTNDEDEELSAAELIARQRASEESEDVRRIDGSLEDDRLFGRSFMSGRSHDVKKNIGMTAEEEQEFQNMFSDTHGGDPESRQTSTYLSSSQFGGSSDSKMLSGKMAQSVAARAQGNAKGLSSNITALESGGAYEGQTAHTAVEAGGSTAGYSTETFHKSSQMSSDSIFTQNTSGAMMRGKAGGYGSTGASQDFSISTTQKTGSSHGISNSAVPATAPLHGISTSASTPRRVNSSLTSKEVIDRMELTKEPYQAAHFLENRNWNDQEISAFLKLLARKWGDPVAIIVSPVGQLNPTVYMDSTQSMSSEMGLSLAGHAFHAFKETIEGAINESMKADNQSFFQIISHSASGSLHIPIVKTHEFVALVSIANAHPGIEESQINTMCYKVMQIQDCLHDAILGKHRLVEFYRSFYKLAS